MFFLYYILIPKILLLSTVWIETANNSVDFWNVCTILFFEISFLAMLFFLNLNKIISVSFYDGILNPLGAIRASKVVIVIGLGMFFLTMIYNGIPLFGDDVNISKVGLSNNWFLMRGLRTLVPCSIFILCAFYFQTKLINTNNILLYLFISAFACLLSGYKGYIITYVLVPAAMAYSLFSNRCVKYTKLILCLFAVIMLTVSLVSYSENIDFAEAINYFITRLSYAQAESTLYYINNLYNDNLESSIYLNAASLMAKIGLSEYSPTFNAYFFDLIHGENPYQMQVSIPLFMEGYIEGGALLGFSFAIFESFVYVYYLTKFNKFNSAIHIGVFYLFISTIADLMSNGGAILRFADFCISASLFVFVFYSVLFFQMRLFKSS